MATEKFTNSAFTTLDGDINDSTTSITVAASTGFPSASQYRIAIDSEIMIVTAGAGTTSWTVTRGAESTSAVSHLDGATVSHVLTAGSLDQRLADTISAGAIGGIPSVEKAGKLYFTSDTPYVYRDNGSTMVPYGPIWPITSITDTGFSWMNQGSSTLSTANGGLYLNAPSNGATDDMRGRVKTAPSTPYTITMGFYPLQRSESVGTGATGVSFLFLRESGTGKMTSISYGAVDSPSTFRTFNHTGPTNFTTRNTYKFSYISPIWLRLTNNGTNIIYYVGCSPFHFVQMDTQTATTPFTTAANQYGFAVDPFGFEQSVFVFYLQES